MSVVVLLNAIVMQALAQPVNICDLPRSRWRRLPDGGCLLIAGSDASVAPAPVLDASTASGLDRPVPDSSRQSGRGRRQSGSRPSQSDSPDTSVIPAPPGDEFEELEAGQSIAAPPAGDSPSDQPDSGVAATPSAGTQVSGQQAAPADQPVETASGRRAWSITAAVGVAESPTVGTSVQGRVGARRVIGTEWFLGVGLWGALVFGPSTIHDNQFATPLTSYQHQRAALTLEAGTVLVQSSAWELLAVSAEVGAGVSHFAFDPVRSRYHSGLTWSADSNVFVLLVGARLRIAACLVLFARGFVEGHTMRDSNPSDSPAPVLPWRGMTEFGAEVDLGELFGSVLSDRLFGRALLSE